MFTQFMMALLEKGHEAQPLADDFTAWYTSWKRVVKPEKEVTSSASQSPQLPTLLSLKQVFLQSVSAPITPDTSPATSFSASFPTFAPLHSTSFTAKPTLLSPPPSPLPSQPTALFTTEYFEARPSPKGGIGAFAIKDIPQGTIILAEKPLIRVPFSEVFVAYENLSPQKRKLYRSLYGWDGIDNYNILAIYKTNRFETDNHKGGIFYKSSRFNHACHPYATCTYTWKEDQDCLITSALQNIKNGDEITISYGGSNTMLHEQYGFWCDCPKCPHPEVAAREAVFLKGPSPARAPAQARCWG